MAEERRAPFRLNTRQRFQPFAAGALTPGVQVTEELPRVGFLAGILVQVRGDLTIAGGTMADQGPWNLLRRIRVETNIGATSVYSTSGFGNFLVNNSLARAYRADSDSDGQAGAGGTRIYAFATGADGALLNYFIPIAANDGAQFSVGMINLQAPEIRVTVGLDPANALTDVHSGISAATLTYSMSYLFYEVPQPLDVRWPPLILHRILEDQTPITGTGDTIYTVPRQGTLLQLHQLVTLNGSRNSADVERLGLRINKTDDVYRVPGMVAPWWHTQRYSRLPILGQYLWDFWHADDDPNRGDMRDAINTEAISTLDAIVTVAAGATLGANNNMIQSIRRIVQPLTL